MTSIEKYSDRIFENIKQINEYGQEFWYARELQEVLEYSQWRNFYEAVQRAAVSCENSGYDIDEHFEECEVVRKIGNGANRKVKDIKLSRYACYLIVMNGDSQKEIISLGQTYFAVKTRQQELSENFDSLSEDAKRLAIRNELKRHNSMLADAAHDANQTHYHVGKKVRETIKELGGTMPEDLPTPKSSIKEIEQKSQKTITKKKDE